jgi:hypothetical protein
VLVNWVTLPVDSEAKGSDEELQFMNFVHGGNQPWLIGTWADSSKKAQGLVKSGSPPA